MIHLGRSLLTRKVAALSSGFLALGRDRIAAFIGMESTSLMASLLANPLMLSMSSLPDSYNCGLVAVAEHLDA